MKSPARQNLSQTVSLLGTSEGWISEALAEMGQPAYRAAQILEWVYRQGVRSFEQMSNLPKTLRQALADRFHLYEAEIAAESVAADGTRKMLLRWADGRTTECVLIPDDARRTACISTQVGCPVRCVFCASGMAGVERNLTAAQIIEQVLCIRTLCGESDRLSNVVFMGLGEPLANYENTIAALRIINAEKCVGIGARRITVSTVGLPKQMRRLADEKLQVTLALSLHAPTDELRARLIPWAEKVSIAELVDAARYYFDRTGREVTIEYVLLADVNDAPDLAAQLAGLCRSMRANVNLIRYNPVPELPFDRPSAERAQQFLLVLRDRGVNTHLRRSRGLDIDSACGQLRRRHAGEQEGEMPKPSG